MQGIFYFILFFCINTAFASDQKIDCTWFDKQTDCERIIALSYTEKKPMSEDKATSDKVKLSNTINVCQINPELEICKKIAEKKSKNVIKK